jgi:hypothetical protein
MRFGFSKEIAAGCGTSQSHTRPLGRQLRLRDGTFDLVRRKGDPITFLQHLLGWTWLTIHADEIVSRVGGVDVPLEHLSDGSACGDFDVVSEAAAVIVDYENFHVILSLRE